MLTHELILTAYTLNGKEQMRGKWNIRGEEWQTDRQTQRHTHRYAEVDGRITDRYSKRKAVKQI